MGAWAHDLVYESKGILRAAHYARNIVMMIVMIVMMEGRKQGRVGHCWGLECCRGFKAQPPRAQSLTLPVPHLSSPISLMKLQFRPLLYQFPREQNTKHSLNFPLLVILHQTASDLKFRCCLMIQGSLNARLPITRLDRRTFIFTPTYRSS